MVSRYEAPTNCATFWTLSHSLFEEPVFYTEASGIASGLTSLPPVPIGLPLCREAAHSGFEMTSVDLPLAQTTYVGDSQAHFRHKKEAWVQGYYVTITVAFLLYNSDNI